MKKHMTVFLVGFCGVALTVGLIVLTVLVGTGSFRYRKTKLVIKTESASKNFDGMPLRRNKWKLISGELAKEHELEVEVLGEQTDVGTSENYAKIVVLDSAGADVTAQYDIVTEFGTLEVCRRKLFFSSEDLSVVYDGREHSNENASLVSGWPADGERCLYYDFASVREVGRHQNTFRVKILNEDDEDVSDNYEMEFEYGSIDITYGILVIESGSASKEYDGTPLWDDTYEIVEGALQAGHSLFANVRGSITYAGMLNNEIEYRIYDGNGVEVTNLYEVITHPGILTITPRNIIVVTRNVTRPYYDFVRKDDWTLAAGELAAGDVLEVVTLQQSFSANAPGFYDNLVYYYTIRDARGADVSDCYRVVCEYGDVVLTD
ncbi:MAG: hypothetical protein J5532_01165 [Lachnospiraceae bacterium]|nr:hypothetical protein [Lachnospiraceae bacterium]